MKSDKQGKDTFILRRDFYTYISMLTQAQRGDLLLAIFAYVSNSDAGVELDGQTSMCFEFIKNSIDYYDAKYRNRCLTNQENGKKGGRPPRSKPFENIRSDQEKPIGYNRNRSESVETGQKQKKHEYDIEYDHEYDCEHTHTLLIKEGGAGGDADAAVLLGWIDTHVPEIAAMQEPITEQHAVWMLRRYRMQDIRRILNEMNNKRAYRNVSAYTTFVNFARQDNLLNETGVLQQGRTQYYTWDEVLAYVDRHRGEATTSDFIREVLDGRPVWRKR